MLANVDPESEEIIRIRDYSFEDPKNFIIKSPFGKGYHIGGLQFDEDGSRLCVVSADGCYLNLYSIESDKKASFEQSRSNKSAECDDEN